MDSDINIRDYGTMTDFPRSRACVYAHAHGHATLRDPEWPTYVYIWPGACIWRLGTRIDILRAGRDFVQGLQVIEPSF